jgi:hypothetical protein
MKTKIKAVIKFIPLLLLYVIIVLVFSNAQGRDEKRYIMFAHNLLNGFYSLPGGNVNLWNGPGYPIVLVPFLGFHITLIFAKLLNAVFLFLAVIYFYSTLSFFVPRRISVVSAYLLGMYIPFFPHLPLLTTEIFTVFLVCGFIFHFCQWNKGINKRGNFLAVVLYLGYLALTKVFFGFAIITVGIVSLLLSLHRGRHIFSRSLPVYLGALIVCAPYLIYTYKLTGKVFYWGNAGGESLYWMTSLNSNEFGDWWDSRWSLTQPQFESHKKFLRPVVKLPYIKWDDEFKKQAVANILSNPKKYVINWTANIGRMLFSLPYSYTNQRLTTYFYIVPNMFLVVLLVFCMYPYFRCFSLSPPELHNLLLFGMITFFGSSLLSAYPRQLFPVVPIILLFLTFIGTNILKIEIGK